MLATSHKVVIAFFAILALVPILAVLSWLLGLFFQQDYHPWEESMWDLAQIRQDTDALPDSQDVSARVPATEGHRTACAAFVKALESQKAFSLTSTTYSKIRVRTDCPCNGRQWYEKDDRNWLKVRITRGPHNGSDAWVCGNAVGPTVTPL